MILIRGAVEISPPGVEMCGVNGSDRTVVGAFLRMSESELRVRVGATETRPDGARVLGANVRVGANVLVCPAVEPVEPVELDEAGEPVEVFVRQLPIDRVREGRLPRVDVEGVLCVMAGRLVRGFDLVVVVVLVFLLVAGAFFEEL